TPQHLYGELFKMMAGVDLVHVPYRGGAPAITDLLGGQVQVIFSPVPESIEHIKAGKLRPLAVMSGTRLDLLPSVPTVADFLPGYEASGWQGIGAPKNTPAAIIDKPQMSAYGRSGRKRDRPYLSASGQSGHSRTRGTNSLGRE